MLRPAPAGLERVAADLAAADHEDLALAVRELAHLVRRVEPLVIRELLRPAWQPPWRADDLDSYLPVGKIQARCDEHDLATPAATPDAILDVAERLVQPRGFNGFSYADIAAELGVTKASLHYHFPGKADLGEALIDALRRPVRRRARGDRRDASTTSATKLAAYAELYADVLRDDRMCLCGMLAAEYETLPEAMQRAVARFFDENERWLERVLEDGRAARHARVRRLGPRRGAADRERARGRDARRRARSATCRASRRPPAACSPASRRAVRHTRPRGRRAADLAPRARRQVVGRVQRGRRRGRVLPAASSSGPASRRSTWRAAPAGCSSRTARRAWTSTGATSRPTWSPRAAASSKRAGVDANVWAAAMDELEPPRRYRTIFVCGGFGLGATRERDLEALRRFHAALEPGGTLVFDVEVPYSYSAALALLAEGRPRSAAQAVARAGERRTASDGSELALWPPECATSTRWSRSSRSSCARSSGSTASSAEEEHLLTIRLYFRDELLGMLEQTGFPTSRCSRATPSGRRRATTTSSSSRPAPELRGARAPVDDPAGLEAREQAEPVGLEPKRGDGGSAVRASSSCARESPAASVACTR